MNLSKIIWFVNLLLSAAVVWVGTNMALSWNRESADAPLPAPKVDEPSIPKTVGKREMKPLEAFQPIMDLNVLKTTPSQPVKKGGAEPEEIKITQLDLRLMGTIVGHKGPSFAIIQEGKTRKQELYYLRDFVQGAQITKILADRVLLSLNGKEEALVMSEESEPSGPGRPSQVSRLPERTITPQRVIRRPSPAVRRPVITRQATPMTPPSVVPPQETREEEPEKDSDQVDSSEEAAEKRPPQPVRARPVERPAEEKEQ
jgi:type II secretory pathway component PulC